jgi:glycosyltransferase involved in cell wall biosynthesis
MIKVLMAGPLPPRIGGMATVVQNVAASSLRRSVALELFDTGKTTSNDRAALVAIVSKARMYFRWQRALREFRPDVVHIHTCSGLSFFLDAGLLGLAKCNQVPVVLHVHGARFDRFLAESSLAVRYLARIVCKSAAAVAVLSDSWRQALAPYLGRVQFTIIPNGVPDAGKSGSVSRSNTPVQVLLLANLSQRKGVWEALQAAGRVSCIRLTIAGGEDEPGIAARVGAAIADRKLSERVRLVGPVTGEAKANLLRDADIFLLPSHAEGLPVSMLEAMAAGVPVVASRVGAIPGLIDSGRTGLLVEPGDVEGITQALAALAADAQLRQCLGEQGRELCRREFGMDAVADVYLETYRRVLAASG